MRRYEVENSWPQLGGGVRYLVTTSDGREIAIDESESGRRSGFVRRGGGDEKTERTLLRGAIRAIERSEVVWE